MENRRVEPRLLCADLVDIQWKDDGGRTRRAVANLEDISQSGACVQLDRAISVATSLRITYPNGELRGRVCYCVYREIGYFLGIEFEPGSRWSQTEFSPQHLVDARKLVARVANRLLRAFRPSVANRQG